ncbi:M23 family metallopeptidase [Pseudoalteromonas xiamenensis]|uniref:M23 family metallopeptidase n=1 Tax=Pseudoalteromonas xiamenensis TaxID=882626 RepID=A0A975DHD3_9GAMM|nr:M23 family metallopeptidase [Pseudoalteromonas xiamenensis]QTH71152.1 M23 family metallopeptidase [Pseudoalteromonas xiamenensis]
MKATSMLALLGIFSAGSALAEGQHHREQHFQFTADKLERLVMPSPIMLNTDELVFNDALAKIDWSDFLEKHTPFSKEEHEAILNFAGHYSINPAVLVALMEVGNHTLSAITDEKRLQPFGTLSDKVGFNEQLEDVAGFITQRLYAYKAFEIEQTSANHSINRKTSAGNVAIASFLERQNNSNVLADLVTEYNRYYELLGHSLTEKVTVSKKAADMTTQAASFSMMLPWPYGNGWYSGGAHSNTGSGYPYSSLDFNNGSGGWGSNTPWVQASHSGTVTRFSSCNIRVTHESGYATQYYHMDSLQYQSGDRINQGVWLGRYASNYNQALCQGGQSSGPHVHFSLLQNGYFVSLHNQYISGYRIDVGNSNYDDNCNNFYFERNGYRTCAWRRLYNN